MLYPQHLQEFSASAIAPPLAELNFHSTDDSWFIREWLNWKANERWKPCPFESGWYCHTLDPLTGEPRHWGPFKPDTPLVNHQKGKNRKYEHPAGYETLAIFLEVDPVTWAAIAQRQGVPITPLMLRLRDRNPAPHFWDWVWAHNLPIVICEGAKKAAALLSAGYVAIALPGVWNGRRKRQGKTPEHLIPDLQHFATPGRQIFFCFDHDPKLKTQQQVSHALIRTGNLFEAAGCQTKVIRLPGPEKGVDDFIVARGAESFDQLYLDAIGLAQYERSCQHRLMGYRLTYPIALDIHQRYLVQPVDPATARHTQPLPTQGVLAIHADMGTGKTELLKQIKLAHPQARILNLGHRIALLRNLSTRLGTAIYSDYGWNMWQEQFLSLTADSLHKLKTEGNTYDFVFLDECEQFIQHLLTSSTCKEHRHAILQALKHFIYSAGCIVLSDAHLSDVSLQFILSMRPDPQEQPFIIRNRYKNGDRRVFWYEGKDKSGIVQQIKAALFQGDCIIVACDGLEFSKDLAEALQTRFVEKQIVCINSETSNEPWARSLIESINEPGNLDKIDCLIYSPSVNTGVSIDVPHFDQVFGVFGGGSLAGTDCLQALNRYRPKVDWHVWVNGQPIGGYRPTNPERIKRQKLQENDLAGFLLKIIPGTGQKTVEDEFAWDAWAAMQARRNESLNNLRGDVRYLIAAQGHQVIPLGDETDWQTQEELQVARGINQQTRCQGIINAEKISATEARRLEAKERPTLQDYYKLERYRIELAWGRAVDADLIALDNGGRTMRQFTLLEALLADPTEEGLIQGKRVFFPPPLLAQKDLGERQKLHPLDWRNDSVGWSIRRELGLHLFLDPEREWRNDDPLLQELAQKAHRNALIIKDFLGITIPRNATPIRVVQQLLDQVGLKLVCKHRQGSRGQQVRVYHIDPEVWQVARSVLEYRKTQRQSQSLPTEREPLAVVTGGFGVHDLNKQGAMTTAAASPDVFLTEVADSVDIVQQLLEVQDWEALIAFWQGLPLAHRTELWEVMSEPLCQQLAAVLGVSSDRGGIAPDINKLEPLPLDRTMGSELTPEPEDVGGNQRSSSDR
ncbi:plasmid replication protein, CyRepA1 family [Pantanalinema rosaneae CENA516]|uniref:plasmid replication protein, CyRepA1 family n=1 Tax=Pantanalinema rosaneae TaxID=1620701 RepID=UPI003D6FFC68